MAGPQPDISKRRRRIYYQPPPVVQPQCIRYHLAGTKSEWLKRRRRRKTALRRYPFSSVLLIRPRLAFFRAAPAEILIQHFHRLDIRHGAELDRKSTRLNSSHVAISDAV